MKNPFIVINEVTKSEYVRQACSLNKAIMAEVPIRGIEDEIEGKSFKDIFSTEVLIREIEYNAKSLGIDITMYKKYNLPLFLSDSFLSKDPLKKELANSVVTKFGNRLGLILLSLKLGSEKNRKARDDWNNEHWEYWKQLSTIIIVGGLASGMLGRRLKERISAVFDIANVPMYDVLMFDTGTFVGVQGCAEFLMDDNSTSIVFDLGHTNIKRCIVTKENSRIVSLNSLDSLSTPFMINKFENENDKMYFALKLHKYLVNIISDSYRDIDKRKALSNVIPISIANYNSKGKLNNSRGGFAKLSILGDDYEKILSEDISSELHKSVIVKLLHDGTANALYFKDYNNSICISLGTAFGVGFPEIRIE